jgi:uroporphyrinogen-III synthase
MVSMLVTRPEPDASETARRLEALGIAPVIEPLLVAETLSTTLPPARGFAALAVTSANALRALAARGALARYRHLPLYAVGDRTAAFARTLGFTEVRSADGAFADLVALIAGAGLAGPVFYPSAQTTSGDLPKALAPHGVMVIGAPVYAMHPATRFSPGLDLGALDAALFYSRRTAEAFVALATDMPPRLAMLCMSEAVAGPLLAAHFMRVSLADHPSEDAMLALALSFARDQNPA